MIAMRRRRGSALVLRAEAIPHVELEALGQELGRALAREPWEHALQRLLLGHAGVEGVLPAQAGGDLERLAPVLAQRLERADQEVLVRERSADLHRSVPCGEHREVVLVQVRHGLGVVRCQFGLRDLIDPGAHELAEELPAGLAADRFRDHADGVLRLNEAQWHGGPSRYGVRRTAQCRRWPAATSPG